MKYPFWKYPIHLLANGFGLGLIPFAPGTFGSLIGIALCRVLAGLSPLKYTAVIIGLFFPGIYICGQTARDYGATDPGFIVYDEIVGYLVAAFLIPKRWQWLVIAFVLYRVFDIWKPVPIHLIEEQLSLGLAIMTDDAIAGLYTFLVLHASRLLYRKFKP